VSQRFKALNNLRIQGAIAGGLGGALGWVLVEVFLGRRIDSTVTLSQAYGIDAIMGAITGLCIGLALGTAEGLIMGSRQRLLRGAAIGAGAGVLGGVLGLLIGETIYQPLKMLCFVGRALGWGAFGAVLGLAEGITRRSRRGLRNAALGGAIGGALGGVMFDLVGLVVGLMSGSGAASRAIALVIMGASIGLWIVIMEQVLAPAVLKVLSGRFEGRDFVLDKPRLTVGRDDGSDVPLLGDPQMQPQHAVLTAGPGGYEIEPVGGAPVLVAGVPVQGRQALRHEQILTLGATRLIYRLRRAPSGAAQAQQPPSYALPPRNEWAPPPQAPPAASACPYCGQPVRPQARFCGHCGRTLPGR
jgi:hypothetical protein